MRIIDSSLGQKLLLCSRRKMHMVRWWSRKSVRGLIRVSHHCHFYPPLLFGDSSANQCYLTTLIIDSEPKMRMPYDTIFKNLKFITGWCREKVSHRCHFLIYFISELRSNQLLSAFWQPGDMLSRFWFHFYYVILIWSFIWKHNIFEK